MPSSAPLPSMDDSVLDLLPVAACLCEPASGRILRCNTQAIALWGKTVETETRIHDVLRFIAPDGTPLPLDVAPLAKVVAEGRGVTSQHAVIDRPGQQPVRVSLHIAPVRSADLERAAGLLVFHNELVPGGRESLLAAQERALEMIARGAPLAGILDALTGIVEQQSAGAAQAVLVVEPDGLHLHHASARGLPVDLKKAIDELRIGPGAGTSAAAAFLHETVVTEDISEAAEWSGRKHLALGAGLRAAWSVPIIAVEQPGARDFRHVLP